MLRSSVLSIIYVTEYLKSYINCDNNNNNNNNNFILGGFWYSLPFTVVTQNTTIFIFTLMNAYNFAGPE